MLPLPWKSKHIIQSVGFQNSKNLYRVLTIKSEYLRSLYKIYCLSNPPPPQKGYLVLQFALYILVGRNHP